MKVRTRLALKRRDAQSNYLQAIRLDGMSVNQPHPQAVNKTLQLPKLNERTSGSFIDFILKLLSFTATHLAADLYPNM